MKKFALASVIAMALASTAFAGDDGYDDDDGGDSWGGNAAWFDYGAGGEATNIGETIGDKGYVGSLTTKLIYGGGDAEVSEDDASVNAYAGSHFLTMGIAGSESMGHGGQLAGSAEYGSIFGGGYAAVGTESLEGDDD